MQQISALQSVFQAAGQLFAALADLAIAIFAMLLEHWAAVAWIAFFLFFVRWPDLRTQLTRGAAVAAFLLYILAAFVWGVCSKPIHLAFDPNVDPMGVSILEKFGLLALWIAVAFICGALQDHWKLTPAEVEIAGPPEGPAGGHDAHGGHGHGGHGHGSHH